VVRLVRGDVTKFEVQVDAPSPAWTSKLDQVRNGPGRSEVYISIIEPSPLFVTQQVLTTQRLGLPRGVLEPAMVLARVLRHDQHPDDDGPSYRIAVPPSTLAPQK
jgi:hypothetical protein